MIVKNHYPIPRATSGEPGVVAHYAPCMAVRGAIRDQSVSGLDLTTRTGTPLVGQGTGIFVVDNAGSYWTRAFINVGLSDFAYSYQHEMTTAPSAARYLINRDHLVGYWPAAGTVQCSLNGGATLSTTAFSVVARGPYYASVLYNGANQLLCINGVQYDSDAVVPTWVGGNPLIVGTHGTVRALKVFSVRRTVAQARADYIREFAREVLWQWTPHREFASIATGTTGGDDDWWVPLGAATQQVVWVPDLSLSNGGLLALTDTGAASLRRIEFPFTRPAFGSWLVEWRCRNNATDDLRFALVGRRGNDFTAAGSLSYHARVRNVAGAWTVSLYYENGATLLDAATTLPAANARCALLLTRHVSGDWRSYLYVEGVGWVGGGAVANNVTALSTQAIALDSGGTYLTKAVYLQGELMSNELGA